jgi:hypothetical protein
VTEAAREQSTTRPLSSLGYEFVNGRWFDGAGFEASRFYSDAGVLTTTKPAGPTRVIDLAGAFVIPPFGEAHNHNVEWNGAAEFVRVRRTYLGQGIFYTKNRTTFLAP